MIGDVVIQHVKRLAKAPARRSTASARKQCGGDFLRSRGMGDSSATRVHYTSNRYPGGGGIDTKSMADRLDPKSHTGLGANTIGNGIRARLIIAGGNAGNARLAAAMTAPGRHANSALSPAPLSPLVSQSDSALSPCAAWPSGGCPGCPEFLPLSFARRSREPSAVAQPQ
jgi:hypothetical protein